MRMSETTNNFPYVSSFDEVDWYNELFPSSGNHVVDDIAHFKFASLDMRISPLDTSYYQIYISFLHEINTTMTHLYNLIKAEYNPYDNVFEHRYEVTTHGEVVEENAHGQNTTTHQFGASHGETTSKVSAFDSSTMTDTNKAISDTNAVTNSDTVAPYTDTNTTRTYEDTLEVDRNGNIGTTQNQQMGESELSYAPKLKLVDLFLSEYFGMFSNGVWCD